jgi:hypothetical protein
MASIERESRKAPEYYVVKGVLLCTGCPILLENCRLVELSSTSRSDLILVRCAECQQKDDDGKGEALATQWKVGQHVPFWLVKDQYAAILGRLSSILDKVLSIRGMVFHTKYGPLTNTFVPEVYSVKKVFLEMNSGSVGEIQGRGRFIGKISTSGFKCFFGPVTHAAFFAEECYSRVDGIDEDFTFEPAEQLVLLSS